MSTQAVAALRRAMEHLHTAEDALLKQLGHDIKDVVASDFGCLEGPIGDALREISRAGAAFEDAVAVMTAAVLTSSRGSRVRPEVLN